MTIDVSALWDFSRPELSEERFRFALSNASADDALLLQTQIARTYGIRRDFPQAQQILSNIEPQIQNASVETRARYYLELGELIPLLPILQSHRQSKLENWLVPHTCVLTNSHGTENLTAWLLTLFI